MRGFGSGDARWSLAQVGLDASDDEQVQVGGVARNNSRFRFDPPGPTFHSSFPAHTTRTPPRRTTRRHHETAPHPAACSQPGTPPEHVTQHTPLRRARGARPHDQRHEPRHDPATRNPDDTNQGSARGARPTWAPPPTRRTNNTNNATTPPTKGRPSERSEQPRADGAKRRERGVIGGVGDSRGDGWRCRAGAPAGRGLVLADR